MKHTILVLLFILAALKPSATVALELTKYMTPQSLQIALVPGVETPVAIELTSTTSITSCGDVGALETSISRDRNFIDIYTGGYTITQKQRGNCTPGVKFSRATIDILPQELQEFEVTQIRFWNGPILDAYKVSITNSNLTLTPPTSLKFFRPAKSESLSFTFPDTQSSSKDLKPFEKTVSLDGQSKNSENSDQVVIISIDGFPDSDIEGQLTALMESRGLHATEALHKQDGRVSSLRAIDTGGQFALQARFTDRVLLGRIGALSTQDQLAVGGPAKQTFDVFVSLP